MSDVATRVWNAIAVGVAAAAGAASTDPEITTGKISWRSGVTIGVAFVLGALRGAPTRPQR